MLHLNETLARLDQAGVPLEACRDGRWMTTRQTAKNYRSFSRPMDNRRIKPDWRGLLTSELERAVAHHQLAVPGVHPHVWTAGDPASSAPAGEYLTTRHINALVRAGVPAQMLVDGVWKTFWDRVPFASYIDSKTVRILPGVKLRLGQYKAAQAAGIRVQLHAGRLYGWTQWGGQVDYARDGVRSLRLNPAYVNGETGPVRYSPVGEWLGPADPTSLRGAMDFVEGAMQRHIVSRIGTPRNRLNAEAWRRMGATGTEADRVSAAACTTDEPTTVCQSKLTLDQLEALRKAGVPIDLLVDTNDWRERVTPRYPLVPSFTYRVKPGHVFTLDQFKAAQDAGVTVQLHDSDGVHNWWRDLRPSATFRYGAEDYRLHPRYKNAGAVHPQPMFTKHEHSPQPVSAGNSPAAVKPEPLADLVKRCADHVEPATPLGDASYWRHRAEVAERELLAARRRGDSIKQQLDSAALLSLWQLLDVTHQTGAVMRVKALIDAEQALKLHQVTKSTKLVEAERQRDSERAEVIALMNKERTLKQDLNRSNCTLAEVRAELLVTMKQRDRMREQIAAVREATQ